jgi:hypothetical protein
MTGHGSHGEDVSLADEYLLKPFTIETLLSRIATAGYEVGVVDV